MPSRGRVPGACGPLPPEACGSHPLCRGAAAGRVPRTRRPCGVGAWPPATRRVDVRVACLAVGSSSCGRPCGSSGSAAVLDALPVSTSAPLLWRVSAHGCGGHPGVPPLPSGGGPHPTCGPLRQADLGDTRTRRTQSRLCLVLSTPRAPPHGGSVTLASTHAPSPVPFCQCPSGGPLSAHTRPPTFRRPPRGRPPRAPPRPSPTPSAAPSGTRRATPSRRASAQSSRRTGPPRTAPRLRTAARHARTGLPRTPAGLPPARSPPHTRAWTRAAPHPRGTRPPTPRARRRLPRARRRGEQRRHVECQRRPTPVGRGGEGDGRLCRQGGAPLKVRHVVEGVVAHAVALERHDGGGAEDQRCGRVAGRDRRRVPARARAAVGRGGGAGGGGDGGGGNAHERDRRGQLVKDAHGGRRRTPPEGGTGAADSRDLEATNSSQGTGDTGLGTGGMGWGLATGTKRAPAAVRLMARPPWRLPLSRRSLQRRRRPAQPLQSWPESRIGVCDSGHQSPMRQPARAERHKWVVVQEQRAGTACRTVGRRTRTASGAATKASVERAKNQVSEQSSVSLSLFVKTAHWKRNQAECS